jgi:hypothetical protein
MRGDLLITAGEHKAQLRKLSEYLDGVRDSAERERKNLTTCIKSLRKKLVSGYKTAAFNEQHKRMVRFRKAVFYLAGVLAELRCPTGPHKSDCKRKPNSSYNKKTCVSHWVREAMGKD